MLSKAIRIAAEAFEGKYDKGGQPYILHCIHVMNAVKDYGEDYMIVAVLHDLIEDTDWTLIQLGKAGITNRQVEALKLLTHLPNESYTSYIEELSTDPIARTIKMADLRHNSDIMRMKGLREKDFQRLEKYHKAYAYLKENK